MAWSKTGVLLVFERGDNLDHIVKTGSTIDAEVNAELLKNIFYNKAPLHDGAVKMCIRDRCGAKITPETSVQWMCMSAA